MDLKGAWRTLRNRRQEPDSDQLGLAIAQPRNRFWSLLRNSFIPGAFGFFLMIFMIASDTVHRTISPQASRPTVPQIIMSPDFLYHLGIEVSVAFIIAGLVSFFIEAAARREQSHFLEEAIRMVGNEVVQGVYQIRHDRSYVQAVVASCLAIRHIRTNYEVECIVSEFSDKERKKWGITSQSLLKVEAEISYNSLNISNNDSNFAGRYYIPKRNSVAGLFSRMTYLRVADSIYSSVQDIESLEIPAESPDFTAGDRGYAFLIPAKSRIPTKVHMRAEFAKERSDNEIFTFLRPTIGAKIKFRFNVDNLTIGLKARTATDMQRAPEISDGPSLLRLKNHF